MTREEILEEIKNEFAQMLESDKLDVIEYIHSLKRRRGK